MTNSTDTFWSVDGQSLQTYAFNIETWGGDRQGVPSLRGDDITIPFAEGDMWQKKIPASRTMSIGAWVVGANEDGSIPTSGGMREQFEKNWRMLRGLLWTPNRQIALTKRFYDAGNLVSATAKAQYAGGLTPSMNGRTRASFVSQLKLADPFFYGEPVNFEINVSTSPMDIDVPGDYQSKRVFLEIQGPLEDIELTNDSTGDVFKYNRPVLSGETVLVDVANFRCKHDGFSTAASVENSQGVFWYTFNTGLNKVNLSAAGAGKIKVTYNPVYL